MAPRSRGQAAEADAFYAAVDAPGAPPEDARVQRQAFAG